MVVINACLPERHTYSRLLYQVCDILFWVGVLVSLQQHFPFAWHTMCRNVTHEVGFDCSGD